jgi:hypothetical protein
LSRGCGFGGRWKSGNYGAWSRVSRLFWLLGRLLLNSLLGGFRGGNWLLILDRYWSLLGLSGVLSCTVSWWNISNSWLGLDGFQLLVNHSGV